MYSGILFPTIDPVAVHLGIFAVRWYSLAYIFGIIGAWLLARQMSRYSKSVFTVLKIDDFLIWATIGIVAGGRLGYVLFYNAHYFWENPLQIFAVWQGGMSFHGGLIGVIIATLLFAYVKKIPPLAIGDILVCVAPIGLFFGRLANFVNAELFGRVTQSVPWAMIFPNGGPLPRHPSQLYEACLEGIVLFGILNALWWFSPRLRNRQGFLFGLFLILYAFFRFGVEFTREPDAHLGFVFYAFSMGQLLCVPMALCGFWLIYSSAPGRKLEKITVKNDERK